MQLISLLFQLLNIRTRIRPNPNFKIKKNSNFEKKDLNLDSAEFEIV